MIFYVI